MTKSTLFVHWRDISFPLTLLLFFYILSLSPHLPFTLPVPGCVCVCVCACVTLDVSRLGGVGEVTDLIPLFPDPLRRHALVLLPHDPALGTLPTHWSHTHTG